MAVGGRRRDARVFIFTFGVSGRDAQSAFERIRVVGRSERRAVTARSGEGYYRWLDKTESAKGVTIM